MAMGRVGERAPMAFHVEQRIQQSVNATFQEVQAEKQRQRQESQGGNTWP